NGSCVCDATHRAEAGNADGVSVRPRVGRSGPPCARGMGRWPCWRFDRTCPTLRGMPAPRLFANSDSEASDAPATQGTREAVPDATDPRPGVRSGLLDALAHVAALIVIAAAAARLWGQAAGGRFATDECFHAIAAEWIMRHRALPTVM